MWIHWKFQSMIESKRFYWNFPLFSDQLFFWRNHTKYFHVDTSSVQYPAQSLQKRCKSTALENSCNIFLLRLDKYLPKDSYPTTTTIKSSIFHPLLKYASGVKTKPNAIIFKMASTVNIATNAKSLSSWKTKFMLDSDNSFMRQFSIFTWLH